MSIKVGGYQAAQRCVGSSRPGALAFMAFLLARFPGMANGGIYGCRNVAGSSHLSTHAEGRTGDTMTGTGQPTTASKFVAEQMRVFSYELGLLGIIHNRRCWFSNTGTAWDPYPGSNPHMNHIHWELSRHAAENLEAVDFRRVLVGPSVNGNIDGPTLKTGSRGNDVTHLQGRLRQHGYGIAADGVFGPATLSAVLSFQSLAGIGTDGIVGPITWGRLR